MGLYFPAVTHLDAANVPGMTFDWSLSAPDWDFTGYTAQITIDGLIVANCTITITFPGVTVNSDVTVSISNATTTPWAPGVYTYRVILTAPNGATGVYAYGDLLVLKVPPQ